MPRPKVSVVAPTWNQARYLPACLDSIWFQDYPDLEIIVVADPSPDDTLQVLDDYVRAVETDTVSYAARWDAEAGVVRRAFSRRYPKAGRELTVVANPRRLGQGASYNLGMRLARGEYVTYVASDDLCHPRMLASLAAPLEAGEADFAYADMFVIDDAGRVLREFRLPDYSFEAAFCSWYLCGVAKLYRKSLHERLGYFDETLLANDHECYLRFAMGGARFRRVPEVLYSVRSHAGREQGAHAPEGMARLFAESARLVEQARAARPGGGGGS